MPLRLSSGGRKTKEYRPASGGFLFPINERKGGFSHEIRHKMAKYRHFARSRYAPIMLYSAFASVAICDHPCRVKCFELSCLRLLITQRA